MVSGMFARHRSRIPILRLPILGVFVGDETWVLTLQETEPTRGAQ